MPQDKSIDDKVHSLAQKVVGGGKLDSTYDPTDDIYEFVQSLPKPDIVVVSNDEEKSCFSNYPELVGQVLFWENDWNTAGATIPIAAYDLTPAALHGDAAAWNKSVTEADDDLTGFLTDFITRNT